MKNIKVDFKYFWKMSNLSLSGPYKLIKHYFNQNNCDIVIDTANPEIIFYSVHSYSWQNNKHYFPLDIINSNSIKVLFTRENVYEHWYKNTFAQHLHNFDFVLGFEDNPEKKHYKIPYYIYVGKLYNTKSKIYSIIERNKVDNLYQKHRNIALISRNPHKLRLNLINKFQKKNIMIDCPGAVGNNMKSIENTFVGQENMDNNNLKELFLSSYFFNICPENSWTTGYTTEKLYHAMISGCVPIYWGCDMLDDGFYNKEKVFLINKNLSNVDSIVDDASIWSNLAYFLNETFCNMSKANDSNCR